MTPPRSGPPNRRFLPACVALGILGLIGSWIGFGPGAAPDHRVDHQVAAPPGLSPGSLKSSLFGSHENGLKKKPTPVSGTPQTRATTTGTQASNPDGPGTPGAPQPVLFNGRRYEANDNAPADLATFQRRLGEGHDAVALVGLRESPSAALKEGLAAKGVDLLSYVPDGGWIARVHGGASPAPVAALSLFQAFNSEMRIRDNLRQPASQGSISLYVHSVRDRQAADLLPILQTAGFDLFTSQSAGPHSYLAGRVDGSRLEAFLDLAAAQPEVQLIERGAGARLQNDVAMRITQSGSYFGSTPVFDHGIYGSNQIVAVCDTGLDVDACYFRDTNAQLPPINLGGETNVDLALRKVVAADFLYEADDPADPTAWDNHGHGTSVAGCAAGSDIYDPFSTDEPNGMAPGAKLIVQDAGYLNEDACADLVGLGCPVTNFYPALMQAVAQGAVIHNNSWNDGEDSFQPNTYTEPCRELDLATWSHKQFLVVCAAGNNGLSNTVGSPSVAKNALSVAACLTGSAQERMAGFSSRGWASDGRFKPDLTAPGQNIRTAGSDGDVTTGNCYVTSRSGTSFSSPIVAGLAALVRDYFAQGFYPTGAPVAADRRPDVSAALVKAMLINTSVAMSNAEAYPPARDQGWGRVDLSQSLAFTGSARSLFVEDQPPPFAETPAFPYLAHLNLRSTNQPLKVTLVWTDYPATAGADKHLVNDLDLRVRTPDLTLKGNVLSQGRSVPGGEFDRLNNVEQVNWFPASTGLVEISVWARTIAAGPQDFALVVTGDFEVLPESEDTDGDGLPDYWERWYFGGLAATGSDDPDFDGCPNNKEYLANTSPLDSQDLPRLEISTASNGAVSVRMKVHEARRYLLEWLDGSNPGLEAGSVPGNPDGGWAPVGTGFIAGEPVGESLHTFMEIPPAQPGTNTARFYRVRIETAP
jgi:subtilisin family serine protease